MGLFGLLREALEVKKKYSKNFLSFSSFGVFYSVFLVISGLWSFEY